MFLTCTCYPNFTLVAAKIVQLKMQRDLKSVCHLDGVGVRAAKPGPFSLNVPGVCGTPQRRQHSQFHVAPRCSLSELFSGACKVNAHCRCEGDACAKHRVRDTDVEVSEGGVRVRVALTDLDRMRMQKRLKTFSCVNEMHLAKEIQQLHGLVWCAVNTRANA